VDGKGRGVSLESPTSKKSLVIIKSDMHIFGIVQYDLYFLKTDDNSFHGGGYFCQFKCPFVKDVRTKNLPFR